MSYVSKAIQNCVGGEEIDSSSSRAQRKNSDLIFVTLKVDVGLYKSLVLPIDHVRTRRNIDSKCVSRLVVTDY